MGIIEEAIKYPANWDAMSAAAKLAWVKSLSAPTVARAAEQSQWLREMAKQFPSQVAKDTALKVSQPPVQKATKHVMDVKKSILPGAGAWAGIKGALGATVSPLMSLLAPVAAGAVGAAAIYGTKKKFDKELEAGITGNDERHKQLMSAIKKQRKNKKGE